MASLGPIIRIFHVDNLPDFRGYIDEARGFLLDNGIYGVEQLNELSERDIVERYLSYRCPVCRLFGSRHLAGEILMVDSFVNGRVHIEEYTSTSVARDTRKVMEERLYKIQYIPPSDDYMVGLEIIVDNVERGGYEAFILANLLKYISVSGINIGGLRAVDTAYYISIMEM